jgi:two-component system nitrate/nitrite response regulator NarL
VVKVLIVAENRLYREGLERLISEAGSMFFLVGSVNCRDSFPALKDPVPDVILVDAEEHLTRRLVIEARRASGEARVIALIGSQAEPHAADWASTGVSGLVSTDATARELIDAVRVVSGGGFACQGRIGSHLLSRLSRSGVADGPARRQTLTAREWEVAVLIEGGLSNKEIARSLRIRVPTVKNHVHNILEKLNLDRRMAAAAWIRQQAASQL